MGLRFKFGLLYDSLLTDGLWRTIEKGAVYLYRQVIRLLVRTLLIPRRVERDDLLEIAEEYGRVEYVRDTEFVTISEPINDGEIPEEFRELTGRYKKQEKYVCQLDDIKLLGSRENIPPVMFVRDGRPIVASTLESKAVLDQNLVTFIPSIGLLNSLQHIFPSLSSTSTEREPGLVDACLLISENRYYSWFTTMLPRLEAYEAAVDDPRLVVHPEASEWLHQSLELMGYDESSLTEWEWENPHAERMWIPDPAPQSDIDTIGYRPSTADRVWVRERILSNCPDSDREYPSKIYISRRDAETRRVTNERELIEYLERRGYGAFVLSDMHLSEIVSLFAQADIVIAPHGAGLANILFSENLTVVELLKSNDIRSNYFVLANELKHEYGFVLGDPRGDHLEVDVDDLDLFLSTVENHQKD